MNHIIRALFIILALFLCSSDDEYLAALDNTKWLSRVGELLQTASDVCNAMCTEEAHVLVSYANGWDRTTQVSVGWCVYWYTLQHILVCMHSGTLGGI